MRKSKFAAVCVCLAASLASAPVWEEITTRVVKVAPLSRAEYVRPGNDNPGLTALYAKGKLNVDRYYYFIRRVS